MQNLALYLSCVLIWGSTWFVIKFQLTDVNPILSVSYRFGLAAIVLFIALAAMGKLRKLRYTRRQFFFVALQGFFLFFFNYWLFYLTTAYLTSALVAITFSTITVMNIFNQALFFRIPVSPQVVIASLLGLAGITFVFWPEVSSVSLQDETFRAILLGLFATYTASIGNILSYRNSRDGLPVLETNMTGMAIGSLSGIIFALVGGVPFAFDTSFSYLASLAYLAFFGSVIAFGAYLTLLARIGADRAAYAAVLFPVVALMISTIFENYTWTPEAMTGIALVLLGNLLALTKPERLKKLMASILLKKNPA